ncbi:MAG: chemotaxis protein CheW [Wenzhouxiangellaceae bacterium]
MAAANALFESLLDYEERSQRHEALAEQAEQGATFDGVVFRIADLRLTCGIDQVNEILGVPGATPLPGAKPWLLGMANLRGNLAPLIDLGWYLLNTRTPVTTRTRVLVMPLQNRPIALMVDEVFGQRHFPESEAAPPENYSDSAVARYIERQFTLAGDVWGEFRFPGLLAENDFLVGAAENV